MADYGSTNGGAAPAAPEPENPNKVLQSFTISEPGYNQIAENGSTAGNSNSTTPLNNRTARRLNGLCCRGAGGSDNDGLKVIVVSMFVFAAAVTVALIVDIASSENRSSTVI